MGDDVRVTRHHAPAARLPRAPRRPRLPRGRRTLVALLCGLLLAGVLSTVVLARAGAGTDRCTWLAERSAARASLVTGPRAGQQVLVVGDSYSVGASLPPERSWPVRLPGRVHVAGFGGSGFTRYASPCGDRSYATRLALALREHPRPALVVLEGGLNDTDRPDAELRRGFARVVRVLAGRPALVVGPAPAPARSRAQERRVDATLARLAARADLPYISMLGLRLGYLPDRLHPTSAGQRRFGDRVATRVEGLLDAR